jgi:hypothetical protein
MLHLFQAFEKKINSMVLSLYASGGLLLILCLLILWYDLILKIVVAIFIFTVAYIFIYFGMKLSQISKDIKKHLDF